MLGMATNMAPHNLGEVIDATLAVMDNPGVTVEELLRVIPGPDFPTGGTADFSEYNDGERGGRVKVRAKIEERSKLLLAVTELPFGVTTVSPAPTMTLAERFGRSSEPGMITGPPE